MTAQQPSNATAAAESAVAMDELDRRLLNIVQTGFPIVAEPYKELGEQLGTSEEDILARLQRFKDTGAIRRIGGIFDSRKLGYRSTLCAMRVPEERYDEVAEVINAVPGVTHNYRREHEFNMWFTLIAPSTEAMEATLDQMRQASGCDIHNLPATRFFKIKVDFNL
ncbi:AsnC family transcriptional regulator [Heliophilum fasciatum]|uniref:siroheme decarboxylase n=1 Tax=Heliophilum fasciatum TaxID=35700 RepID=A7UGV5_9FIRM|nr:AsnC family transcriptional regulator [Heliophilum fasciatum]ABU41513.1 NirD [Heliophilum fasciatum]MCW2278473.1 DNA-binding Lrp family transcriptional regulator [Heliophilum fasciatum]TCP63604.1 DNA-binding Lrp family transcriptional regulator [Heliophilum fasciatum]